MKYLILATALFVSSMSFGQDGDETVTGLDHMLNPCVDKMNSEVPSYYGGKIQLANYKIGMDQYGNLQIEKKVLHKTGRWSLKSDSYTLEKQEIEPNSVIPLPTDLVPLDGSSVYGHSLVQVFTNSESKISEIQFLHYKHEDYTNTMVGPEFQFSYDGEGRRMVKSQGIANFNTSGQEKLIPFPNRDLLESRAK